MTDDKLALRQRLSEIIAEADLHHMRPPSRYDAGDILEYEITGVCPAVTGRASFRVEKFIGGGFAGQVYRVILSELDLGGKAIPGLDVGGVYAMKIIVPPSRFSLAFRNTVYWFAYQGSFAAQVNHAAARTGVLWQKIIRRGVKIRFGGERAVADTYATFFDAALGSYGEINEWIEGRNWRFEVDDDVLARRKASAGSASASQEYLAKKKFMAEIVELFHEMGAPELARQYEWWTCKSQPNVLKRKDAGEGPAEGLTALDFRAGLALLPFLPMSPADFSLIVKGLKRGALVQFDRGNLKKLDAFIDKHWLEFEDLGAAINELSRRDPEYRDSQPDVTHHAIRLIREPGLRESVRDGLVQGWQVRGLIDEVQATRLKFSRSGFWRFFLLGFVPFLGKYLRRLWWHEAFARHVHAFFSDGSYRRRTLRAYQAHTLINWLITGRAGAAGTEYFLNHPVVFWRTRVLMGILPVPAKWHRFLTDWRYAGRAIAGAVVYPVRFYRDAAFRVQWLTNEIDDGLRQGMLTPEEHDRILTRVPDPYIQKYLKCVAVHICTLPITQVFSVVAALWAFFVLGKTWEEGTVWALGILLAFQATPVSPGSITRGTYVVYLMIKERNWRNYWVAVLVSYWHYIGYLGFPLQMVTEFPALARFMAGRWATKMVGIIPVFGESGALLEHWVFDTFFNLPLTLRRRFRERRAPVEDA